MKKSNLLVSIAALALLLASCGPGFETVAGDPLDTKIYTLDNGLQVYMTVNKQEPRIQTYMAVKVGGKNDPSETTGLAHYFEHLMFKGTENFGTSDYAAEKPMLDQIEALFETYRQTTDEAERAAIYHKIDSVSYEASKLAIPNEYDKLMSVIGADGTNAWTSEDETVYTEDIPSNQIDNWAKIQADRFRNNVIRGFHTELETIYEEKNMSLTQDMRKVWEGLSNALYPSHPYGQQTVLGTQEHLKNPSISNVKKYHDTYYVPNNIRICLSGDFDPKEMVKVIEKYFGDWEPNPDIPVLDFAPEAPITEPVVRDVYGLESEMFAMAWRLPGAADLKTSAVAQIASEVLNNGQAGLIDLDVNQQQKVLGMQAGYQLQPDYSSMMIMARPKQGQTLEQVRAIALEELAKLRSGEFDESLVAACINNIKLQSQKDLERNDRRAQRYIDAFINGISWKDAVAEDKRLEAVTKEDIVAFASEYLCDNNYVVVNKRQGVDTDVQKISAPAITPIVTNRDMQSDFLKEVQASEVKPIEPVFVDFDKDMAKSELAEGVELLYKHNEINELFQLSFVFNRGILDDPLLGLAADYLSYLGTEEKSYEDYAKRMYELACDWRIASGDTRTTLSIAGLAENMAEAVSLVEELVAGAKGDKAVLASLKADSFRAREMAKTNQRSCYSALNGYILRGPEYVKASVASNADIAAAESESLLAKLRELVALGHEIRYYGPAAQGELRRELASCHKIAEGAVMGEEASFPYVQTSGNSVLMAQYDAAQIYYMQYSNDGRVFDTSVTPSLSLYNEYFGGGMNTIVFQEMREARGLAYSAWARLYAPSRAGESYFYTNFIATQNDKMKQAVEAFAEIINDMPQSEAAFAVAKEALLSRLRTQRVTGANIFRSYDACRRLGLSEPQDKQVFEAVQAMSLADVVAFQQEWVKDRSYTYGILGDIADLDLAFLRTLGPVKVLTLEEIFGY